MANLNTFIQIGANTGNFTNNIRASSVSATGNVTGGAVSVAGNVTASGMTITGDAIFTGNANVLGTLTFNNTSDITTSNLVLGLGNDQTGINVTGGGIAVGNTAEASFLYDFTNQTWNSNLGITANGTITGTVISASGNVTGNLFIGNGSQLTNLPVQSGTYANANVSAYLGSNSNVAIVTAGNITGGLFIGNGSQLTNLPVQSGTYANANVFGYLGSNSNVAIVTTGNITGDTLISAATIYGNVDMVLGNNANTLATKTRMVTDTTFSYIQTGNGTVNSTGNIVFSPYKAATPQVVIDTASGNLSAAGNITAQNFIGNTAGFAIGYRDLPQVTLLGNVTLAGTDAGKHYYSTLSTANTITIANNTSVSWAVGTAITVVNRGTGNIVITQGTGVSLYLAGNSTAANRTLSTYGMATLLNVSANVWMINGTGLS